MSKNHFLFVHPFWGVTSKKQTHLIVLLWFYCGMHTASMKNDIFCMTRTIFSHDCRLVGLGLMLYSRIKSVIETCPQELIMVIELSGVQFGVISD